MGVDNLRIGSYYPTTVGRCMSIPAWVNIYLSFCRGVLKKAVKNLTDSFLTACESRYFGIYLFLVFLKAAQKALTFRKPFLRQGYSFSSALQRS